MNNLINALGSNIKERGRDRWVARCPVHNDKDFAMSISQAVDGSVIAHCHACGANGLDLYQSLGLDLDELFGGRERDYFAIPSEIKESYELDLWVLMIGCSDYKKGISISYKDKKRLRLARARVKGIEDKFPSVKSDTKMEWVDRHIINR